MLTKQQQYAIATMLSIDSLDSVVRRLSVYGADAIAFAQTINKHYKKRDGFIPQKVLDLLK